MVSVFCQKSTHAINNPTSNITSYKCSLILPHVHVYHVTCANRVPQGCIILHTWVLVPFLCVVWCATLWVWTSFCELFCHFKGVTHTTKQSTCDWLLFFFSVFFFLLLLFLRKYRLLRLYSSAEYKSSGCILQRPDSSGDYVMAQRRSLFGLKDFVLVFVFRKLLLVVVTF